MANKLGNPICRCLKGLVPKPDTITGCGPECTVSFAYSVLNLNITFHTISCYFMPFYTIFLQIDPDCKTGYICKNQKCVERPDPCNPNPCGPNAICEPVGLTGQFTCKCPSGFIGNPKVSCTKVSSIFCVAKFLYEILKYFYLQAECQRDEDCAETKACSDYNCIDPCRTVGCQKDFFCKVIKHIPTCGKKYVPEPQEVSL